jgi:hypothetical protein
MHVPFVRLQPGSLAVASAGWALESLQAESLRDELGRLVDRIERIEAMHRAATRFLQLVARWEAACAVEIHLVSRPSLDPAVSSRTLFGLRLHVAASHAEQATEECLAHAVLLEPLLNHLWEGAEFRPLAAAEELRRWFEPFAPQACLRVRRRIERLWLAHPFEARPKAALGFAPLAAEHQGPDTDAFALEHCFPWVPSGDDWGLLIDTLLHYPAPQWLIVRMANRAPVEEALRRCEAAIETCERFLAGSAGVTLAAQTQLVRDVLLNRARRLRESALRGAVLLLSPGPSDAGVAGLVGQSISGDLSRGSAANPYQGGFSIEPAPPEAASEPLAHFEAEPFTAGEAACAFRLPLIFSARDRGLPVRRNRVLPAQLPPGPPEGDRTRLGVNRWQGAERAVEVGITHRLKHTFLIGMTGTGKSTSMLSMLLQDLEQGRGVFLIDPHGDLAEDLLVRLPRRRQPDLILIDLADRERPVPLNLLAWKTLVERDIIIDELLASLLRIYRDPQMFGPIFETNFRAMLKLLMGDRPRASNFTLLEFPKLYLNEHFRKRLVKQTGEDEVKDFIEELERVRGENSLSNLAPYVTNKFARFLQDPQMRRILGHGAMALDFSEVLETGKVVIVKLARGQFGASVADLLASHLVARVRLAAMARAALPRERRTPYFLYVDEFGSIARDENFSRLLSEARKYGLGLVLSTQYAAQLRDPDAHHDNLAAVLGNAGTVISFRVGVEDARLLEPVFAPAVSALDLAECPNFEGYMRLHLDGCAVRPFSFRNLPPAGEGDRNAARRLAAASRRRWGVTASECDRRIAERRRSIDADPLRQVLRGLDV